MKLLILCNKKYWDTKMSRVRFHAMEAIERHPDVEAVRDGEGYEGWIDAPTSVLRHKPDAVFWYKPLEINGYEKVTVPKVISYNEMYDIDWTTEEITKSKSDIVICHHKNDMNNYDHLITKHRFHHIHHCAEKTIFKDYGENKIYDVLFVGVNSESIYPIRGRIKKLLHRFPRSKVLEHPGYRINDVNKQVVEYAKEINRAKLVVSCSSKYKYALAKYSEIPMCKTLLVADIPDERAAFFRKFVGEVNDHYTDAQLVQIIDYCLKHEKERQERINLGYKLTIETSTQEHYAEKFIDVVKDYLQYIDIMK